MQGSSEFQEFQEYMRRSISAPVNLVPKFLYKKNWTTLRRFPFGRKAEKVNVFLPEKLDE